MLAIRRLWDRRSSSMGTSFVVVGIIGRDFETDTPADLFVPFQFDLNSQDMAHYFTVARA